MANRDISIRLSLKDGETVRRALESLGKDGQAALARIEKQSAPASKGLLAVNAATGELRGGMTATASRLGAVGAGLSAMGPAGLVAAAGVAVFVAGLAAAMRAARQAVDQLNALDDTAQKLGIGVEALQEWRYAFEQEGVSAETLEMALQRLGRRMGEIANFGKGEAKDALKQLGVAVTDAAGRMRTLEDVLPEIADALAGVADQNRRLSLAQKLFDSEGVALVTLLQKGSAELARYRAEARELGLVLDEHLVSKAADAADKLDTMDRIVSTQLNGALVDLAPAILAVASAFAEVAKWVGDVVDGWREIEDRSTRGMERRVDELNTYFKANPKAPEVEATDSFGIGDFEWKRNFEERERLQAELKRRAAERENNTGGGGGGGGLISPDVTKRIDQLEMERNSLQALIRVYGYSASAIRSVTASKKADEEISKLKIDQNSDEAKRIVALIRQISALNQVIAISQKARSMNPDIVLQDRLAEIAEIRATGIASEDELTRATEEANRKRLGASRDGADGIKRAMMDIRDASRDTAQQWEDDVKGMNSAARSAFVGIVTGAKTMAEALNSILSDIESRIAGRIYDKTIGTVFDSALDSVFGAKHAGGIVGAPGGMTRAVNPLVFAGAPRLHSGGLVPGERPIIALERERVLTEAQQDNTAKTIAGLASMVGRAPSVNLVVNNTAGRVAQASASASQGAGGGFDIEVVVEEIEDRIWGNVAKGEGGAPVIEGRYGLDPAAGARR